VVGGHHVEREVHDVGVEERGRHQPVRLGADVGERRAGAVDEAEDEARAESVGEEGEREEGEGGVEEGAEEENGEGGEREEGGLLRRGRRCSGGG